MAFEESFTAEFEEYLLDELEERVSSGGRLFLEEYNDDWRGYKAIIRDWASRQDARVDDLSRDEMVNAVGDHLEEFGTEYELDDYE